MVPDLTFSKAMARLLLPQKPTNRVDVTLTSEINRLCAEIRGADGDALTRVYDGAHVRPGHGWRPRYLLLSPAVTPSSVAGLPQPLDVHART